MEQKTNHVRKSFFSIAFGLLIISAGVAWFLQSVGVLPHDFEVLNYACPLCIVLLGIHVVTAQPKKRHTNEQE